MHRFKLLPLLSVVFVVSLVANLVVAQDLKDVSEKVNVGLGRVVILESSGSRIRGTGSGFVVEKLNNRELLFLTNKHVTPKDSYRYVVGFLSKEGLSGSGAAEYDLFRGEIMATDQVRDLSLLKLTAIGEATARNIAALEIYTGEISQGIDVASFGYPGIADTGTRYDSPNFYQSSLTSGVVSRITSTEGWNSKSGPSVSVIHHDAAINQGNSGGPLVSHCGRVLGVNTQLLAAKIGREVYLASSSSEAVTFLRANNVNFTEARSACGGGGIAGLSGTTLYTVLALGAVALIGGGLLIAQQQGAFGGKSAEKKPSAAPATSRKAALEVWYVNDAGEKVKFKITSKMLQAGFVIGRDSASDVHLLDGNASRKHAKIRVKDRRLLIEDLNSANGTFVDDKQLAANDATQINSKSKIVVGNTQIFVR